MIARTYSYKTEDVVKWSLVQETKYIELPAELNKYVTQADKYYESSRRHINDEYYYIWKWAYKAYHLSTRDRQSILKSWQSNVAFGFIRAFIDVFASTLTERPVTFTATPYDELGINNATNVAHSLNVNADITGFNDEAKKILNEWLKTWTFAVRISYTPDKQPVKYITIVDGIPVEHSYTPEIGGFPNATHVNVFKIFPDPSSWPLRYVTERDVLSLDDCLKVFNGLISNKKNKSPFKDPEFIKYISLNQNDSDLYNYGIVINEVHRDINRELRSTDSFTNHPHQQANQSYTTYDSDPDVTEGLVEYKYTVTNDFIVLTFNGYPVYIGDNIFGFIPYVIKPTVQSDVRIGCEWVPYLLRWMETTVNSYMNNYLDGVRSIATPSFIGRKWAFIDEEQLQNLWPGDIVWAEMDVGNSVLQRMEKGTISDYNVLDICTRIAQQITGISEYNLWVSARERTATGANATSQSSQKRLSPFLVSFVSCLSAIAKMWVKLQIDNWTTEKFLILSRWEATDIKKLKASDLAWSYSFSVDLDSIFAAQSDLQSKKLTEMFNLLKGGWIINEPAFVWEIVKSVGLSPSKLILQQAPAVTEPSPTAPTPWTLPLESTLTTETTQPEWDAADMAKMLQEINNPQVDLGNGWQGK